MYYAGIDAHAAYLMVAAVDRTGSRVLAPIRVSVRKPEQLLEALRPLRPLQAVVETCAFWPWIYDLLGGCTGMAEELAEETLGRLGIPAILDEDVQNLAMLVDGSPQVLLLASDPHEDLIEEPRPPRATLSPA